VDRRWLRLTAEDLEIERRQCEQEGRDLNSVASEFARLSVVDLSPLENQAAAEALLDLTVELPLLPDYPYDEPSDLESIRAARPAHPPKLAFLPTSQEWLADRLLGAWLGRCCGCLLGKPVEGWRRERMWGYLKATDRFPLASYFSLDAPSDVRDAYRVGPERAFIETVTCMPEDDDTNYTVTGLAIAEASGPDFTPADVGQFWLNEIPILHTCTAERVAYRNLSLLIAPPESARRRNPYREWIGAQIRADFWGYLALGRPELAAELAWRDASVSHVKNGIYGEMWAAAMIAAAPVAPDIETAIRAGLAQIPERCRLAEGVGSVLAWHRSGAGYDEAVARLHAAWDEHHPHDWCHTISNAMVVCLGLLWGEGEFGPTLCRAVQPCFDTDCNGATAGSVIGLRLGAANLPHTWTAPLNDTLETGVAGFHRVSISELAQRTARVAAAFF